METRFDGDQDELYGVTKEQFQEYVELQRSGKTNMWGASRYLGWSPVPVIQHYGEMCKAWPDVAAIMQREPSRFKAEWNR